MIAAVTGEAFERVREAAPDGVEVRTLDGPLEDVAFLVPDSGLERDLAGLPALEVVQVLSAGTEWIEDRLPPGVTLCNARGTRDIPVAEWVVAALLGAATGTLAAAERLEALGVTVQGVARRARDGVHGMDELPDLLPHADAVILLTPLTPETAGLVDAAFLGRMADGALFVNAGRGKSVDTDALLAELESGRLRAVLDVVEPEPLPDDHPLWEAPGLLALTSHQAGDSPLADARAAQLAGEQLGRWTRGEPLENVIRVG